MNRDNKIKVGALDFYVAQVQNGILNSGDMVYATVIIDNQPVDIVGNVNEPKGLGFNVKIRIPAQLSNRNVVIYNGLILEN